MPRCQICDRRRKHVSMMEIAGMLLAVCLRCRDQLERTSALVKECSMEVTYQVSQEVACHSCHQTKQCFLVYSIFGVTFWYCNACLVLLLSMG